MLPVEWPPSLAFLSSGLRRLVTLDALWLSWDCHSPQTYFDKLAAV